jgi:hypothetical protein
MMIQLPARLQDDLNWDLQMNQAERAVQENGQILWEFDFAFSSLHHAPAFQSYAIALDQFVKQVWPVYESSTLGISLHRGPLVPCDEELFVEWLSDLYGQKRPLNLIGKMRQHLYRVFCMNTLAEYLHRLGSYLPETAPLYCFPELSSAVSLAETAHLLSKERFGHIQTSLTSSDVSLGVCLPLDEEVHLAIMNELDEVLDVLEERGIPYRVIPESLLTEEWAGLDQILVIPSAVTHQGKRKLQGFLAAGGEVVSIEEGWEKTIGAEGFEPPTHCSQSSCASQTALCSD